nr:hypothetical protein [Serratia ureilytica]
MQIDKKIRALVARMNACGLKTYASCQGHGFPVDRLKPYVAFRAPVTLASALARRVREDAESASPRLRWGWEVTASFNSAFALCYRLAPTQPHRGWQRYWRPSVDHDLHTLRQYLNDPVQQGDRVNEVKMPEHLYHQQHQTKKGNRRCL